MALVVAVVSLWILSFGTAAFAQDTPCTAAPPATPSVSTSVSPAIATTPAMVNVVWAGVPFTGSAAVTTYLVEVGTASGLVDVARAETGGQTVTYSHAAANGTYYIRIRSRNACGTSGPSVESMVTVSGSPFGDVAVTRPVTGTSQVGADNLGNVMIMGEISGTWGSPTAAFVKVTATFTGPLGVMLGSDFTYVYGRSRRLRTSRIIDDTTIAASETACYALYTDISAGTVKGVSVNVSWSTAEVDALTANTSVERVSRDKDAVGGLKIGGAVRNAGGVTTYFNQAVIDVRDAQNRLIDCDFTEVDGSKIQLPSGASSKTALAPGQAGPFQSYSRAAFFYMDRVLTWPTWDEPDAGAATPTSVSWRSVAADTPPRVNDDARERARARNQAIQKVRDISRELDGK